MQRFRFALALSMLLIAGCTGGGYWQDATHRPAGPSAGAPESATGPTADPDARVSALPRAVVAMGREARGDLPILGVLTGSVLLIAVVLGVYTVGIAFRRRPSRD